jgi:hypothetical protein
MVHKNSHIQNLIPAQTLQLDKQALLYHVALLSVKECEVIKNVPNVFLFLSLALL